jgi:hypothetical protein
VTIAGPLIADLAAADVVDGARGIGGTQRYKASFAIFAEDVASRDITDTRDQTTRIIARRCSRRSDHDSIAFVSVRTLAGTAKSARTISNARMIQITV